MNAPAQVVIRPGYFSSKTDVLGEITRDDLWPLTIDQGAFAAAPLHCHDAAVRIYVLAGEMIVQGGRAQPIARAHAGTRIDLPAGAPHTVSAEGRVVTIVAFTSSSAAAGLPQLPVPEGV